MLNSVFKGTSTNSRFFLVIVLSVFVLFNWMTMNSSFTFSPNTGTNFFAGRASARKCGASVSVAEHRGQGAFSPSNVSLQTVLAFLSQFLGYFLCIFCHFFNIILIIESQRCIPWKLNFFNQFVLTIILISFNSSCLSYCFFEQNTFKKKVGLKGVWNQAIKLRRNTSLLLSHEWMFSFQVFETRF